MADPTPRQRAQHAIRKADAVLGRIAKEAFLTYEDEAYIATQAQFHATKAVACALLDVADAIRSLNSPAAAADVLEA